MANFHFHVEGDTNNPEDVAFIALLAQYKAGPAPVDASGLSAAEKPARTARKGDKGDKGSTTDATAASPATEPVTPLEQQTSEQQKAVDPAVAAAQAGDAYAGKTQPVTEPAAEAVIDAEAVEVVDEVGETSATPTAEAPGDVTMDSLKKLLSDGIGAIGAKRCQDVLRTFDLARIGEAPADKWAGIDTALRAEIAKG